MKPVVFLVGADKGGVGKTTLTRTLLDYLPTKGVAARAFDTEFPRGTLKRFFPKVTEVVDITTAADQMKVLDTLTTSEVKVSTAPIVSATNFDQLNDLIHKTPTAYNLIGRSIGLYGDWVNFYVCDITLKWNGLQAGGPVRTVRIWQQPTGRCTPQ